MDLLGEAKRGLTRVLACQLSSPQYAARPCSTRPKHAQYAAPNTRSTRPDTRGPQPCGTRLDPSDPVFAGKAALLVSVLDHL